MSRIASPGEKVSLAVTIGTILIPELGFDHFDCLNTKGQKWHRVSRSIYVHTLWLPWLDRRRNGTPQKSPARQQVPSFQRSNPAGMHYIWVVNTDTRRQDLIERSVLNGKRRTLGFRLVKGLNRLLKLSANMTACSTSSSSMSFSLPAEDFGAMVVERVL